MRRHKPIEALADSAEVRPHLRFPVIRQPPEFQDSMMREHFHVPDVRNAIRDSAWELASIRLLAVILQTILRDSEWQVGPEMRGCCFIPLRRRVRLNSCDKVPRGHGKQGPSQVDAVSGDRHSSQ